MNMDISMVADMTPVLALEGIQCAHDGQTVVDGLTLNLYPGTLNCLLGPSGCGKTTLLRAIAGFEALRQGQIQLAGQTISDTAGRLPPEKRNIGMVFQDHALFPHLNVADNIGFALRRETRRQREQTIAQLLELIGLEGHQRRYPHELSGGQQQRIALARALAPNPALLLLDEPFSSLDVELRERLALDIRDILKARRTTALFVTHDQHEAFLIGEHVGVMKDGRLLQWSSPYDLYHAPASRFVADFIGKGRFLEGRLKSPEIVETAIGDIQGNAAYTWPAGTAVDVLLRPDDVSLDEKSRLRATITGKAFKGAETLYTLRLADGNELLSLVPSHQDYSPGQPMGICVEPDHLILFRR